MRSIAFILAFVAIAAALTQGAGAQDKMRLAQSSTVTNCMMNCNAQVASCRTTCVVPTPPAASSSTSSAPPPISNAQATTPCLLNCNSVQLACQSNCALQSPSQ
jgi:hypothetical protein